MLSADLGLNLDGYSWLLYLLIAVSWLGSVRLMPDRGRYGWQAVPMSLFGMAWLGFFLHFILRFLLLCNDSFTFGNMTPRLAMLPPEKVNFALFLILVFWLSMTAAYCFGRRRQSSGPLYVLGEIAKDQSGKSAVLLGIVSTVFMLLTSWSTSELIPLAILTPLSIVGSFWVLPATFAWWDRFRGMQSPLVDMRWILLGVGVVKGVLSPYREQFIAVFAAGVMGAFFAGKRLRVFTVVVSLSVFFLISTLLVATSRSVLWEQTSVDTAIDQTRNTFTLEKEYNSTWVAILRRFHGLDSVLLTVKFVPDVLPFSGRTVFMDSLTRGFVPRAFFAGKERSVRGMEFSANIWNGGDRGTRDGDASIAPTMAGDLYEAGGIAYVILGAICWGYLLGAMEGWKMHLPNRAAAALAALLFVQCAASVERDFVQMMASTFQMLILLFIVGHVLGANPAAKVEVLSGAGSSD